jgi:antitoxin component YwqK of YwqJK toxin-antitoxin module/tetratricopeptide (TPR) repeat protein
MHLRHYGAAMALLAMPGLGLAQTTPAPTYTEAAALIKEGVALHDAEKYNEAAARYQLVMPGDSAYAQAQAELALSLLAAEKYQGSIEAARRSLAVEPFEPELYSTLGSAHEELKQLTEARQAYAAGLKLFPYNENLWLNQGVLELNQHQTGAALGSLQRALELRPAKASAHRLLGILAARQGQTAHAMLSLLLFLAIEPEGSRSNAVLVDLERLSQGISIIDKEDQTAPVANNTAFEDLDQLLTSKVALNAAYTTKVKFKAAIVKQLQLLVEKFPLEADPASDFWLRAYGPVVKALRQDDNLTTFTYLILSSADDKSAQQWLKGNKSRLEKLTAAVSEPLLAFRSQQPRPTGSGQVAAWFDGPYLEGLGAGQRSAKGEVQPSGDWLLVAQNGSIRQRGTFSAASERTGKWLVLRPDGSTETEMQYNAKGELDGPMRYYYPSGQLQSEATYRQGKLEGGSKAFAENGQLTDTRQFVGNDYEGEAVDYLPGGAVSFRAKMHADKRDGLLERFYADGTPEVRTTYVQGKAQGESVVYYPDKTVEKKSTLDQDELHGPYATYFPNGKVRESGQYTHGKRTGPWKEYFATGKLSVEQTFDATGELHGSYLDYDAQGRHYATTLYEHGRMVRLTDLDAQGKIVADTPLKKGRTTVKNHDAEGRLRGTGDIENGHLVGEWKTYYPDGTLYQVQHYDATGVLTGVSETYYANGQLHQRRHYGAGGVADGYFEQYYATGKPLQTGFQRQGQEQGVWKSYYPTGQLSQEQEYFHGDPSGLFRAYEPGGKLTQERLFAFGKLRQLTTYDSTGKAIDHHELTPAIKEIVLHYPGSGKKVLNRAGVANGHYEGTTTWLRPSGQPETVSTLRGGQRYGTYRSQYDNGQTQTEGQYLGGKLYGQFSTYYPDGTVRNRGRYLDDEPVGEWVYNFPNGKPQRVQAYNDEGELDGTSRYYNPADELLLERHYQQGRLIGFAGPGTQGAASASQVLPTAGGAIKTAFATGKPAAEETYVHNYPSGNFTYYYASGQVYRRVAHQQGVRHGLQVSYWPSGKLMEEESYQNDELHGRCRYYRPDGTLEREETYRAGERSGPTVAYDAQGRPQLTEFYWNNAVYNPR